jgi:predicted transcriptional regulator
MRFGTRGSKKIELEGLLWADYEACEYGGVVELCRRAGNTENLGNGADSDGWFIPYSYCDRNRKLLYQVVKRPLRQKAERFFMRRPDPADHTEWVSNLQGVERVLYRLPELIAADPELPVFICEGEKDVDNVRGLGLVATCNPGGSGKWRIEFNEFLDDADVVILPDNDKAGERHAADVSEKIAPVVRSCAVVRLPGLGPGEDVSDWIGRGGTRESLLALVAEARIHKTEPRAKTAKTSAKTAETDPPDLEFTTMADLEKCEFAPLRWIVPNYIPEGLTLLSGKPKIGKSWLAFSIVLARGEGTEVLGETCPQGDVLYCALEDSGRRMKERGEKLLGRGMDWPAGVYISYKLNTIDAGGVKQLSKFTDTHPSVRMIIIDTLASFRGRRQKDEDQHACDYRTLKTLQDLSIERSLDIIVIHHIRKQTAEDVFDTISGTQGLAAAADTLVVLTKSGNGLRLCTRGRDTPPEDKLVDFDPDTYEWTVTGDYEVEDNASSRTRDLIKAALAGAPPMSPAQVAEKVGLSVDNVRHAMRRMTKDCEIKRTSLGLYEQITP